MKSSRTRKTKVDFPRVRAHQFHPWGNVSHSTRGDRVAPRGRDRSASPGDSVEEASSRAHGRSPPCCRSRWGSTSAPSGF
jgi:hypothetical protein